MRNPAKKFIELIKDQESAEILKGNFSPLQSNKKIEEIRNNLEHEYKHLRQPFQNFYRVYINSHFVLIFNINHTDEIVTVYYFGHHDEVYRWGPTEK